MGWWLLFRWWRVTGYILDVEPTIPVDWMNMGLVVEGVEERKNQRLSHLCGGP